MSFSQYKMSARPKLRAVKTNDTTNLPNITVFKNLFLNFPPISPNLPVLVANSARPNPFAALS